jgi:hypothetical protein
MNRHKSYRFPALRLVVNGQDRVIRTVADAAETLIYAWPSDDGEEYVEAVRICLDALYDVVPAQDVRAVLIRAANEENIPHF